MKFILKFNILIFLLLLSSCVKLEWDLKRDNPADQNINGDSPNIKFSKFEVVSDNNGDGVVNKGESIKLKVYLKNTGRQQANQVRASISASSSYISTLIPTTPVPYNNSDSYYDYIPSGDERYGYYAGNYPSYTLSFNVSGSTPDATSIPFNISISDESGNTWNDIFYIVVSPTGADIKFSKYEVVGDNNGDGIVNKGESIKLKVYLKNQGTSDAYKVRGTITTTNSYISSLIPTTPVPYNNSDSYYDYIPVGDERFGYYAGNYPSYTLSFNVSNTTPPGTNITFNIAITDETGNSWTDTFTVTVIATGANIKFSRIEVVSDDNNNGIVNKGESVKLKVYLQNTGSSTANKVRGTISTTSIYVSNLIPTSPVPYNNSDQYYDYIPVGSERFGYFSGQYPAYTMSFKVSSSITSGSNINFNIDISDESNNSWADSFSVTVY